MPKNVFKLKIIQHKIITNKILKKINLRTYFIEGAGISQQRAARAEFQHSHTAVPFSPNYNNRARG